MQAAKFQRLYILLHPCAKGGGGYARLEQTRGKYALTINVHGFSPSEEGLRVLLAARDDGSGAAVCDLGPLPISAKGQSSLHREVSLAPGGLPIASYAALCIAKDWPNPKLLLLGPLEENNSLSSYLIGETVCRYLSVPSKTGPETDAGEASTKPASARVTPTLPAPVHPPATAGAVPFLPSAEPAVSPATQKVASKPPVPLEKKPASDPPLPVPAKSATFPPPAGGSLPPFPQAEAAGIARPASAPVFVQAASSPPADEAAQEALDPAVFTAAMDQTAFPTDVPAADPPRDRPSLMALPKLQWPAAVKELERYFSTYPPFSPFDAPGWRFVQVPMAAGSTIPYYAVGMLARDGRVTQVAYAVPGDRGALPPPGFAGYRWQQGRNGQGYWTLWKRAN